MQAGVSLVLGQVFRSAQGWDDNRQQCCRLPWLSLLSLSLARDDQRPDVDVVFYYLLIAREKKVPREQSRLANARKERTVGLRDARA